MWPNPQETADLVTFTDENLNRKLHFLCSVFSFLKFIFYSLTLFRMGLFGAAHWWGASSADISIFSLELSNSVILMISAKLVTPGLVKIKIFRNKGYDVIILDYDVTYKILSRDSNYIADVVMWPRFGN